MLINNFLKKFFLHFAKKIRDFQNDPSNNQDPIDPYWAWLFLPFVFSLGCIFYIKLNNNFQNNKIILAIFFITSLGLFFYNFFRSKYFIYLLISSFLAGVFYNYFYDKFLYNYQIINFKSYLKISGEITEIKPFYNPLNHLWGSNLLIKNPAIEKFDYRHYQNFFKDKDSRSIKKKRTAKINNKNIKKLDKTKPKTYKKKRSNKIRKEKKIPKNFQNLINLSNFQEIDRKLTDFKNNYNQGNFLKINNKNYLAQPPPYLNISVIKNFKDFQINQNLEIIALFQPIKPRDFKDDFDFELYSRQRKIGGYGFGLKVIENPEIGKNNIANKKISLTYFERFVKKQKEFFLEIRKKISQKILKHLDQESGSLAIALLVGDQSKISSANMENIRRSGLSHLLSISGFHLSLASLFFLISARKILTLFSLLVLRFDLKKISAVLAILASYCYLMISDAAIPAQRAFIMVLFLIFSYFFNEKFNGKRALVICFLLMTLINPYQLFNISLQLSFVAILVLVCFYQDYHQKIFNPDVHLRLPKEKKFWLNRLTIKLKKIFSYCYEVFLVSVLIQIATLPFLIQSFSNFSLIAPLTNIIAIPLTSLLIMPSGFLALALMPFSFEKIPLFFMNFNIKILQEVINIFGQINFANIYYHNSSQVFVLIAFLAILIFCFWQNKAIRILAIVIFLSSFFVSKFIKNPTLIIAGNQNYYALFHPNLGLRFSEFKYPTKQIKNWQKKFNQKKLDFIKKCSESTDKFKSCEKCIKTKKNNYCLVYYNNQQILVIKKRSQISELCKYNPKIIINLSKKYQLPKCYQLQKIKPLIIDNIDFINHQTHKIFYDDVSHNFNLVNQF